MRSFRAESASHLPLVLEGFRQLSGLVVIVALLFMVLNAGMLDQSAGERVSATASSAPLEQEDPQQGFQTQPSQSARIKAINVYYIVETEAQAFLADWGESVGMQEGLGRDTAQSRHHQVLYTRTPDEEHGARQIVFDFMAENPHVEVQVVDLRVSRQ